MTGGALARHAVDPDGALGAGRGSLTPLTRFQASARPSALRRRPRSSATRYARVVARGVVDHRQRETRAAAQPSRASVPRARDAGLLARPHLRARRAGTAPPRPAFPRARGPARRRGRQCAGARGRVVPGGERLARAGEQARALAQRVRARGPQRPERLARGADPHERGARHQLVAEDAHVAPALQRPGRRAAAASARAAGRGGPRAPGARALCLALLTDRSIYLGSAAPRAPDGWRPPGGIERLKVAAVQLNSTADRDANIALADRLVRAAAADGATPDRTAGEVDRDGRARASCWRRPSRSTARRSRGRARSRASSGRPRRRLGARARARARRSSPTPRCTSTRRARSRAVYRKVHMFDVEVGGRVYRESELEQPGEEIVALADRRRRRAGHVHLLRPALPRAVPDPRRARRADRRRAGRLHAGDDARPLGDAACAPARSRTRRS